MYVPANNPVRDVPVIGVQTLSLLNLYSISVVTPLSTPSLLASVVQATAVIPVGAFGPSALAITPKAVPTIEPVSTELVTTTLNVQPISSSVTT